MIAAGLPQVVAELRSAQAVGLQVASPLGDVSEAARGGGGASPVGGGAGGARRSCGAAEASAGPAAGVGLMLAPSVWRPDGPAAPAVARLWRGPRWCATGSSRQGSGRGAARHRLLRGPGRRGCGVAGAAPRVGVGHGCGARSGTAARHSAAHYLSGCVSSICTTAVAQRSCSDMSVSSARCFRPLCTVGDT